MQRICSKIINTKTLHNIYGTICLKHCDAIKLRTVYKQCCNLCMGKPKYL
uniref:Uncharacterized protein n=1 Tax=Anguilla anguilla TaxID=7936 RepID=A0A0E9WHA6_ANGAN